METVGILVIVCVVSAVLAAWIANAKGASDSGMWGMAGLFFGPVGVILALAFAKPAR